MIFRDSSKYLLPRKNDLDDFLEYVWSGPPLEEKLETLPNGDIVHIPIRPRLIPFKSSAIS